MRSRSFALGISLSVLVIATAAGARNPWQGQPPYGLELMTEQERKTYWRELLALQSEEEKEAYWRAHVEKMQQRALERGVGIPSPPTVRSGKEPVPRRAREPYFEEIMSPEERKAYREAVEAIEDPAERMAFVRAHVKKMHERALERGVSPPPVPPSLVGAGEEEPSDAESESAAETSEVEGDEEP